ncbi:hypothetical protein OEA41_009368 [Lepraria neglecta]|uniref:Uncharacterized protein n=1 Tax=Lepraria neglecta TaxID=209136 RepID=A0AAD9Z3F7_9LECA|nr:hypothetical protein OEA41_009368 [Lepraria neglecta]
MGPVVKLIGSGIGLVSEAMAARKERKERSKSPAPRQPSASGENVPLYAPPSYNSLDPNSTQYGLVETANEQQARELIEKGQAVPVDNAYERQVEEGEVDQDETYWELDEAVGTLQDPTSTILDEQQQGDHQKPDVRKMVQKFLTAHPAPSIPTPKGPLPCPVILPQRRPHTKARGFVRAYAPVLEDASIDQDTFMEFLKVFHRAQQASPVFSVIFVAGHLIGYVPSVTAMAAATSIQVAAGTAIGLQRIHRTNTFLDEINDHFFHPRGVHALLMSYKPERSTFSSAQVDISHTITSSVTKPESMGGKIKDNMKFTTGKTYTEMELPASAPLIFPDLDAAADADEDTEDAKKKQNFFKKGNKFVGEYMDRRAQAEYGYENPNSQLSVPDQKPFASRYSDPTHPASSGSLISLVTGGKVDPKGIRQGRRQAKGPRGPVGRLRKATGTDKPIKKLIRQNVVYLMIVNLPSEEEMAAARAEMEREKMEKEKSK